MYNERERGRRGKREREREGDLQYHESNSNKGIGRQVKNTDIKRNDFLPQTSDRAPSNGAERKDKRPYGISKQTTNMYI